MAFGFVSSPSQSPTHTLYHNRHYFDSTSEGSGPDSPNQMNPMVYNSTPMQYDMYHYSTTPANYYPPQQAKIPVEFTGSSTLDDRSPRRRRAESISSTGKDKDSSQNMHLRRRAQNRASQRAFRERKEKHVKGLEHQLEDLHEKHQDLLQSYTRQADEVTKLNARIAELASELAVLRVSQNSQHTDQSFTELLTPDKFDKFDAFSTHDIVYNGPDYCFNKNAVDMNSEFSLHSFEDSL